MSGAGLVSVHPEASLLSSASAASVDIQDPPCLVIAALVTLGWWSSSLDWLRRALPRGNDRLAEFAGNFPLISLYMVPSALLAQPTQKKATCWV